MAKFNPSKRASDLQQRTRTDNKFDEFESKLPDPKSDIFKMTTAVVPSILGFSSLGGLVKKIGDLNPLGKNVTRDDIVWVLDNTAFIRPSKDEKHGKTGKTWEAEFVVAVFEGDPNCNVADIVASVAQTIGLADDAAERETIHERILPFLWDVRMVRTVRVSTNGGQSKLTPTNVNGISSQVLKVPGAEGGSLIDTKAVVPAGTGGIRDAKTFYAGSGGWAIISDIDDTVKITQTGDPLGIVTETFANEPRPVPGMPELYAEVKYMLPADTPWFYLSASPYNLYPFLKDFRDRYLPPGTLVLRDFSWKTVSGLLSALTQGTEEYKTDRMAKINRWFPGRKLIVVGDSTQSDPEAYGEVYRTIPGWIRLILIRKVEDIAAVGTEEKNRPERFEDAFRDVPREAWHTFTDPAECKAIIESAVSRNQ